ncbi:MAG: helix-turn-helix transcriptional regulator [Nitrosopumilaceae archaeon]
MNQQMVVPYWQDHFPEDGMLFVRTRSILTSMGRATLVAVGLIVMAISMPIQSTFGTVKALDLIVYSDGTTHVSSEISTDPLQPDFSVNLFGPTIDNFVAEDENGFLLSANIEGNIAVVETLGASVISVNYDIHDLVSKEGRIWSFKINSPVEFSLLMPGNIVIVGMSTYPLNLQTVNDQSQLLLAKGPIEINYFFGVSELPPPTTNSPDPNSENSIYLIGGGIVAAGAIAAVLMKRSKKSSTKIGSEAIAKQEFQEKPISIETIFEQRPELREDDKQLIAFISDNGGQAYESELRKKFLQPRTTMWRAVKRLERYGIIEIEKKELQNLVILKKKLEDEK